MWLKLLSIDRSQLNGYGACPFKRNRRQKLPWTERLRTLNLARHDSMHIAAEAQTQRLEMTGGGHLPVACWSGNYLKVHQSGPRGKSRSDLESAPQTVGNDCCRPLSTLAM
jgi:hypothetical protein